jgi:hypothetical protein
VFVRGRPFWARVDEGIVGGELYPKIANLQSNKGPSDCDVSKVCRLKAHIK